jgi:hypothetical protein
MLNPTRRKLQQNPVVGAMQVAVGGFDRPMTTSRFKWPAVIQNAYEFLLTQEVFDRFYSEPTLSKRRNTRWAAMSRDEQEHYVTKEMKYQSRHECQARIRDVLPH